MTFKAENPEVAIMAQSFLELNEQKEDAIEIIEI